MCGIAGLLAPQDRVSHSVLKDVSSALTHRGPDDEGIETLPVNFNPRLSLGLVHRRLSIIDLSPAAHQPMQDKASNNWIVFNGEIYNHRDIRKELASHGHTFDSQSDTEVILKAYTQWGQDCLGRLRGMFAFGIWDQRHSRLFLAVDRFGIKPLYYSALGKDRFLFCSEVRAALRTQQLKPDINRAALSSFLAYGAVQAPLTMVKGLVALLPGHCLTYECQNGTIHTQQYWSPSYSMSVGHNPRPGVTKENLPDAIRRAVRDHLVSDVPLGIFLSGGVDSSALAILVSQTPGIGSLKSFSVSFTEPEYSESRYSRIIAKQIGCDHDEIVVSEEELYRSLPAALTAMDQPSIDGINTYIISRAVREAGIKAVLSGQGGDEVFGGYNSFTRIPRAAQALAWTDRFLSSAQLRRLARSIVRLSKGSIFGVKAAQSLLAGADPVALYLISRQLFSPETQRRLAPDHLGERMYDGLSHNAHEWLRQEIRGLDLFNTVSLLELRCYLANMLLRDSDTMSMAHGLEIRVPFLDHEIVSNVFAQNASDKFHSHIPKPLLISTVAKALPTSIYQRPKMGFTFPWDIWLRQRLRPEVEATLHDSPAIEKLGLSANEIMSLWNAFSRRDPSITWSRIWAIYSLLSWSDRHLTS